MKAVQNELRGKVVNNNPLIKLFGKNCILFYGLGKYFLNKKRLIIKHCCSIGSCN